MLTERTCLKRREVAESSLVIVPALHLDSFMVGMKHEILWNSVQVESFVHLFRQKC